MVTRTRLFSAYLATHNQRKLLFLKESQKLARVLLSIWHNNNNKHRTTQ
jgi:hypothetical protein